MVHIFGVFRMKVCPSCILGINLTRSCPPPRWADSAAPQLLDSGVALLHSSICSINCLKAQLVSGSRLASSTRCGGDGSRETAGPPVPPAEPVMVIRRAADRPRCGGSEEVVSKDGRGRQEVERERERDCRMLGDYISLFVFKTCCHLFDHWLVCLKGYTFFFLIFARMSKCHVTSSFLSAV